ncbi:hypothetical protein NL676_033535 [Syzygium grande]|nr:hypothetical protein NL676_033535 [Syzygium grande]
MLVIIQMVEVARPMEGLGKARPAPFLRKTCEMVSDPDTDRVVSWGSSWDSFVVGDEHEFSKQVLPRYFKHSNFSSFIRQLNTYVVLFCDVVQSVILLGHPATFLVPMDNPRAKEARIQGTSLTSFAQGFRKINSDRWEFANEGFQGRKKHLLKNIKRRRKFGNHTKPGSSTVTSDYPNAGKEAELETLKKDQEVVKAEILKLIEEREKLQHEINQVAERIRYAVCRHRQMFLFLAKAAKSPKESRRKRELDVSFLRNMHS